MQRWVSSCCDLAAKVQAVTGDAVEIAFGDQGPTGAQAAQDAAAPHRQREVVQLPEAKKGLVRLPKRWVVERSNAWAAHFRRLARDYERLAETLAGLHFVAFAILMLKRFVALLV
jgi:transposase